MTESAVTGPPAGPSFGVGTLPGRAFLAEARAAARALMRDECRVERVKGSRPDPNDPDKDVPVVEPVWSGECQVRPSARGAVADKTGVVVVETWSYTVSIPFEVVGVQVNDQITIASSDDPSLTGKRLKVESIDRGTNVTARRLACQEVAR
ncbi:DUF6093 family protein (plasmid) [Streptomyces sp. BI20]|uniref:DUF6093 family protein n=1 Tax=Streptomyces sp. BI20 TaxID=3403460 RepID=UPI003C737F37